MEGFFLGTRGAVDGLIPSQDRTLQALTRACSVLGSKNLHLNTADR